MALISYSFSNRSEAEFGHKNLQITFTAKKSITRKIDVPAGAPEKLV